MLKKILIGVGAVLVAFIGYVVYLNVFPASPKQTAEYKSPELNVSVVYGQPSKKGRLIFGEEKDKALQPYGKYWRLGANATTDITFDKNILFAGKPVNAGTYRMYAVPGPTSFQVSLNSEAGKFLGVSEPDYSKDIVKVDVPTSEVPETEKFTITFGSDSTGVVMDLTWDKTRFSVPLKVQ